MLQELSCPSCRSSLIKKNGHTHYGKQNYGCKSCGRQFVEKGQEWFVSEQEKEVINKLLLERISLAGICRVIGVSESWLLGYIKELYAQLPEALNAQEQLPDLEDYLAERTEEEISRLKRIKKIKRT